MRTVPLWSDSTPTGPPGAEGKPVVWDAAFRVDGSLLVVAVGKTLVVYNPNDGTKIKSRVGECCTGLNPFFLFYRFTLFST